MGNFTTPYTGVSQFDNGDLATIWAKLSAISNSGINPANWTRATEGAITLGANFSLSAPTGFVRIYKQITALFSTSATVATRRFTLVQQHVPSATFYPLLDSPFIQAESSAYNYSINATQGENTFLNSRAMLFAGNEKVLFSLRDATAAQIFRLDSQVTNIQAGAPEDQFTSVSYLYQDIAL